MAVLANRFYVSLPEANKALGAAGHLLNGLDQVVQSIEETSIIYIMDKRPKDTWNFIVGTQYQINKHFMLRGEYSFPGTPNNWRC